MRDVGGAGEESLLLGDWVWEGKEKFRKAPRFLVWGPRETNPPSVKVEDIG